MIETLIYGNNDNLKIYKCGDKEKCLDLGVRAQDYKKDESYMEKVNKIVYSVSEKLISESKGVSSGLTEEEKHLIATSSVPIMKIGSVAN
jgi:hypothetical protein